MLVGVPDNASYNKTKGVYMPSKGALKEFMFLEFA